jgi:pimeloyl-ACP methyl ester carboxylesterase
MAAASHTRQTISLRGHDQVLHVYGTPFGRPVIISSGDGGWIHLGPHVAEVLAAKGYFVVGFDVRGYLESFTTVSTTLRVEDVPADYKTLIDFAAGRSTQKPILIGVSEGAGLSVLAATDSADKKAIEGVVGLGLSDVTELGWRWRDMVIYLTHRPPHEPTFSVKALVNRLSPVPLAAIHSTHDEYVPLTDVQQVLECARAPKRLWTIDASNHRFSDNEGEFDRALLEAITWIVQSHVGAAKSAGDRSR